MKSRQIMLAFRLAMSLFIIGFGANALWKAHRLDQDGVSVQGTVTQFISGKNSRYVFSFPVGHETYWGRASGNFAIGQNLEVKYLAANPGVNEAIRSDEINPGWPFCGIGFAFAVLSVFLFQKGARLLGTGQAR